MIGICRPKLEGPHSAIRKNKSNFVFKGDPNISKTGFISLFVVGCA